MARLNFQLILLRCSPNSPSGQGGSRGFPSLNVSGTLWGFTHQKLEDVKPWQSVVLGAGLATLAVGVGEALG